jgi:ribosomal protein L11 methylase PrmA
LQLEIVCKSRTDSQKLVREFGGRGKKLPRDWLKRFARAQESRPLRIGKRLIILRSQPKREADSFPYSLIIPAGEAFGTGDHATTAMSLVSWNN